VLVGDVVYTTLRSNFGGGPEIQFFLISNDKAVDEYKIPKDHNLLYSQPYTSGFPDKNPEYYDICFKTEDLDEISYRLLLSKAITPKSLLYFVANKLKIDVYKLSLEIIKEDGVTVFGAENNEILLHEICVMNDFPKLQLYYGGKSDEIGSYENDNIYAFFEHERPITSTNDQNSSTDAIDNDYIEDRDDFDTNIIVEDLNIDNQVPPEYQNDPDLWYTIQASLKEYNDQQSTTQCNVQEPEIALADVIPQYFGPEFNLQEQLQAAVPENFLLNEEQKVGKTKTPSTGA